MKKISSGIRRRIPICSVIYFPLAMNQYQILGYLHLHLATKTYGLTAKSVQHSEFSRWQLSRSWVGVDIICRMAAEELAISVMSRSKAGQALFLGFNAVKIWKANRKCRIWENGWAATISIVHRTAIKFFLFSFLQLGKRWRW